jgi:hypothetical protein
MQGCGTIVRAPSAGSADRRPDHSTCAVEAGGTPKAYYHSAAAGEEEAVSLFAKRSASNLQMAQNKLGARDRASTIAEAMY